MKRLCILTLGIFLLLSQWAALAHEYHVHKADEICDICIISHSLDHQLNVNTPELPAVIYTQIQPAVFSVNTSPYFLSFYSARAPPRFI